MKIAIVIPTIRPDCLRKFMKAWQKLFDKHNVKLVIVLDGKYPTVNGFSAKKVMGKYADCLTNFTDGIRNLGFAYVAKYLPNTEAIITLDDDETPFGDTIRDHVDDLQMKVPISWMSTALEYMRGFHTKCEMRRKLSYLTGFGKELLTGTRKHNWLRVTVPFRFIRAQFQKVFIAQCAA